MRMPCPPPFAIRPRPWAGFAARLLERAGLASDRAADVADILVEGDLMGHTTHGLQLLGPYLKGLEDGAITRAGEPEVVADRGGTPRGPRSLAGPLLGAGADGVAGVDLIAGMALHTRPTRLHRHRLSRGLPAARDRARARDAAHELGPGHRIGRAARRHRRSFHAEPDRRRVSDRRAARADRH